MNAPESLWHFLAAWPASFEAQIFYALLFSGIAGIVANYTAKWWNDSGSDTRWCLMEYLFKDHIRRTVASIGTYFGLAVAAVGTDSFFTDDGTFIGWSKVFVAGLTTGFTIDGIMNKTKRAAWTDEQRAAKHSVAQGGQGGFGYPEMIIAIAAVVVFAGYSAWIYRAGGEAPRAELASIKQQLQSQKDAHDKKDKDRDAQTETLVKEKDDERQNQLVAVSAAWAAEHQRLQLDRDRIARERAQSAQQAPRVCDNADGNNRLLAALAAADRATDDAVAEYQDGTGRDLEVCDRQTRSWDNLKSSLKGLRLINTEAPK